MCEYCGKLFVPEKLAVHQRYFCGPAAEKTAKQSLQKTKARAAAGKGLQTMGPDTHPRNRLSTSDGGRSGAPAVLLRPGGGEDGEAVAAEDEGPCSREQGLGDDGA